MTTPRDKQLLRSSGFPYGVNNLAKEEALPRDPNTGEVIALREAENVDLDSSGKPSRRDGYTLVQAGSRMHSAWSDDYLPFGFEVDGEALYAVQADESRDLLVSGLALGLPLSYARINDAVWWTNSVQSGQVTLELETRGWSAPHPNGEPSVAAAADGALDPGRYQVAVTFLDQWGRESGAERAVVVTLDSVGAIAVTNLPQPPAGCRVRVYLTGANDAVLHAAVTVDAGVTTVLLTQPAQGRRCDTLGLRPMPAGQLVAYGNGRQYVARGNEVLYSPALRYGLYDPKAARVGFVQRVDMLAFVGEGTDGAGLFVSDGKRTYFFGAPDPANWSQRIAYPCGAVPGQIALVPG
ncbi:MAG: hypothetical protein HOQ02_04385, partial [Lysobacter sp.]|nr:hypothetical protein [Lysobacter sp.]